ncbi:hypothetical protein AB205_0113810 [Aquarana catesbeiana]|uniref:Uncharacterized protein n=1 Tax=Aquarana catesbeiana TaxID=8400 RepID=A0A2G9RST3_AQUCT|nr:hypothetical protein AB205_0113810 [Aquarana catesbeiana]
MECMAISTVSILYLLTIGCYIFIVLKQGNCFQTKLYLLNLAVVENKVFFNVKIMCCI